MGQEVSQIKEAQGELQGKQKASYEKGAQGAQEESPTFQSHDEESEVCRSQPHRRSPAEDKRKQHEPAIDNASGPVEHLRQHYGLVVSVQNTEEPNSLLFNPPPSLPSRISYISGPKRNRFNNVFKIFT